MDRRQLLERLLDGPASLSQVEKPLRDFPYDCEEPLVVLRLAHVRGALQQYLSDQVSATDVENWAELLEGRPDVDNEGSESDCGVAEVIAHLLFQLSTPSINGSLTPQLARQMVQGLDSAL
jgi:hypothetical protein